MTASGGSSGILIANVHYDESTSKYTLNRTFREIMEAVKTGPIIIYRVDAESDVDVTVYTNKVTSVEYGDDEYIVRCDNGTYSVFVTEDLDGYPINGVGR